MNELILNLAPTGNVPTRRMSVHVPLQPREIVADILRCAEEGITLAHIHARDEQGAPTYDKDVYARIIGGVRDVREDIVLCVSCSGRNFQEIEKRAEVLDLRGDLKPDMASLTLSSLNFSRQASLNAPDVIQELAQRMRDAGIKPELEVFDLGMANYARYLQRKGLIEAPLYANLFFGNVAAAQATLNDMAALVNALPAETVWSFAGLGASQRAVAAVAIAMGGGVRAGLEDNLWEDAERTKPATNPGLVAWVHTLARAQGRPIMRPRVFRKRVLQEA